MGLFFCDGLAEPAYLFILPKNGSDAVDFERHEKLFAAGMSQTSLETQKSAGALAQPETIVRVVPACLLKSFFFHPFDQLIQEALLRTRLNCER